VIILTDIGIIFKIATVGIIVAILDKIFESMGREEQATLVTLAGLVVVLMMVIGMISNLFDSIKTMFQF
jgi:stage III sporulation protein AC